MEDFSEVLKVMRYEVTFCTTKGFTLFSKFYFLNSLPNKSEQFFYFKSFI